MLLQIRHGSRIFQVEAPRGCRIEPTAGGRPALLIPGERPGDTCTWLPASEIVSAARHARFGLRLRGEHPLTARSA